MAAPLNPSRCVATSKLVLTLTVKQFRDLTDDEFKACLKLTLPGASSMRNTMHHHKSSNLNLLRIVMAHTPDGTMAGWALNGKEFPTSSQPVAFFFVPTRFRRQGVGRALTQEILRRTRGPVHVCPWNKNSTAFFNACVPLSPSRRLHTRSGYGELAEL